MLKWILVLTLGLVAIPSHAITLKPFEATYKTSYEKGFKLNIEAKRTLKKTSNGEWVLDFYAENWFAKVQQTSRLVVTPDQKIQPIFYRFYRSIFGKSQEEKLTFHWDKNETHTTLKSNEWTMSVPEDTQDLLSFQLRLRYDLLENPEQTLFTYPVVDEDRIKLLNFRIIGEEVIDTPMGKLNAIKIESMHHSDVDAVNHLIWAAKDWDNLVLRIDPVRRKHKQEPVILIKGSLNGKTIRGL